MLLLHVFALINLRRKFHGKTEMTINISNISNINSDLKFLQIASINLSMCSGTALYFRCLRLFSLFSHTAVKMATMFINEQTSIFRQSADVEIHYSCNHSIAVCVFTYVSMHLYVLLT